MLKIRSSVVRSRQIELSAMLPELPTPKLLGLMGYVNCLVGCLLIKYGAAVKTEEEGYQMVEDRVEAIVNLSRRNELSIAIPITYTSAYLAEHWPMATNHRPFLRDMRSVLAELGMFTYEPKQPRQDATRQSDGSCKSPPSEYHDIDFCSLVTLYELLESMFLGREKPFPNKHGEYETYSLEDLPEHRGELMRMIFQAIASCEYRRTEEVRDISYVPEVELSFFMEHCPDNFQGLQVQEVSQHILS